VKVLQAIAIGAISSIIAILIHQTLPPFGVAIALAETFIAIWWVGRSTGKKFYKVIGSAIWLAVVYRAGTFGEGRELLIMGDGVGTALLLLGFITVVSATLKRI
jgi:hypothetical protein